MKYYLEINEILTEEESLIKQPQTLRLECVDKDACISKHSQLIWMFWENTESRIHYCWHEDWEACSVENI